MSVLRFNRRNWKAVVLCIFAATVFWFLNALNKTYTTNLKFPLSFDYDRDNFVPVSSLPTDVRINVTGNGWMLFRRSAGLKIPPLEIPLERPVDTKKILGNSLPSYFNNQLDGLQINYVLTDTIYVDLEPKTGRWISLTLDSASINLKEGYTLASYVSILPDSIYIEGPKPTVNSIEEPVKLTLPFEEIDDHFMEDVEIKLKPAEVLRRDPPTVAVMFNVERLITIQDSIELRIENLPEGVWPVIGRKEIPISISLPENMTEQLEMDSLYAVLNLKRVKKGEHMLLPRIVGLPPFTSVLHIDSVKIKF